MSKRDQQRIEIGKTDINSEAESLLKTEKALTAQDEAIENTKILLSAQKEMFIVRRKDPPAYDGVKTFWITVGHRDTEEAAKQLITTLKKYSKKGTSFWYGEEEKENNA